MQESIAKLSDVAFASREPIYKDFSLILVYADNVQLYARHVKMSLLAQLAIGDLLSTVNAKFYKFTKLNLFP